MNDGIAARTIGGWEEWGDLPDHSGCFRFFGRGNQQDLEKAKAAVGKAADTLKQYLQLPVPSVQAWRLPIHRDRKRSEFRSSPPLTEYYRLLEWLCNDDDSWAFESDMDVAVMVDGKEEFLHSNWGWNDFESANFHCSSVEDFVRRFARAVARWVPEGLELGVVEEQGVPEDDFGDLPPPKTTPPVVRSIMVRKGVECLCLEADEGRTFSVPRTDAEWIMRFLLRPIARGTKAEPTSWAILNALVGGEPLSGTASSVLRSAYNRLNRRLAAWGQTPDGKPWIGAERGEGAILNQECGWQIEAGLKRELRRMKDSVSARMGIDPNTQGKKPSDYRQ